MFQHRDQVVERFRVARSRNILRECANRRHRLIGWDGAGYSSSQGLRVLNLVDQGVCTKYLRPGRVVSWRRLKSCSVDPGLNDDGMSIAIVVDIYRARANWYV
jgi:hypothetical protein